MRKEHAKSDAAVKRIERITGANSNSIKKWISGRHAPKSGHLLLLAKSYPHILRMVLELIGRSDVWDICAQQSIPQKMLANSLRKTVEKRVYYDRFVGVNVVVDSHIAGQFNQRQLWFLGKLQQGHKLKTNDIAPVWRVTARTAQRDIAGLMEARLIQFTGAPRNGHYQQMPKD